MPVRPGEFESTIKEGILLVRVHKAELKSAEAEHLIEIVFDDEGGDCEQIVLNLTEVEYINSTVMSALSRVSVARDLRVVGMQPGVERILDTMGLLQFLDRSTSEDEALQAFTQDTAGGNTPPSGSAAG